MNRRNFLGSSLGFSAYASNLAGQTFGRASIGYLNGGLNWPLFIAASGGYYSKCGIDVNLVFAPHPTGIAMIVSGEGHFLNCSLEQALLASAAEKSLRFISTLINRGAFALLAWTDIRDIKGLKGKKIGIGQIGDANHSFAATLLVRHGLRSRDVQWVPLGPSVESRAAALISRRVDAAMLTAPSYFKIQSSRVKVLVDYATQSEIYASSVIVTEEKVLQQRPGIALALIRAHAEAVGRFYQDKKFAVHAFMQHQPMFDPADVAKMYDLYAVPEAFERIPYVLREAVESVIRQQADEQLRTRLSSIALETVVNNQFVDSAARDGTFEMIFGRKIAAVVNETRKKALF